MHLFIDFLEKLLKLNPNERLSAKTAIEHPFIVYGDRLSEHINLEKNEFFSNNLG